MFESFLCPSILYSTYIQVEILVDSLPPPPYPLPENVHVDVYLTFE